MAGNEENPFAGLSEYDFNNLIEHLEAGDQDTLLHELLALETPAGRNAWYEAREKRNEAAGYLGNIERAWRLSMAAYTASSKAKRASAIGDQCRYALIAASINSMTSNIPAELLVSLVEKRILDSATGLIYARRLADPAQQVKALVGLAPHLDQTLLGEALSIARQLGSASGKGMLLVGIAPCFPPAEREALLDEAWTTTGLINIQADKTSALTDLAHQFAAHGFPAKALDAAGAIPELEVSNKVMAGLASLLAERGFYQEALDAALQSGFDKYRVEALAAIAPFLPESDFDKALAILDDILSVREIYTYRFSSDFMIVSTATWNYLQALSGLLPYLPPRKFRAYLRRIGYLPKVGYQGKAMLQVDLHREALSRLAPHVSASWKEFLLRLTPFLPAPRVWWNLAENAALRRAGRQRAAQPDEVQREIYLKVQHAKESWEVTRILRENERRLLALGLLKEYLELALSIKYHRDRAEVLAAFAPHSPPELAETVLKAIRAFDDETDRAKLLVAFCPYLPEKHIRELFEIAQDLESGQQRAQVLAGISSFLPPELLREALARTRTVGDTPTVEKVTKALIACHAAREKKPLSDAAAPFETQPALDGSGAASPVSARASDSAPETQSAEAFKLAQALKGDYNQAEALAKLCQSLPESVRNRVLAEALDNALSMENDEWRSYAVGYLAPCLPEPLLRKALSRTQEYDQFYESEEQDTRGFSAQTVAELLPRLAELGYPQEAMNKAENLPKIGWQFSPRNEAFRRLALALAKTGQPKEALEAVGQIDDERYRWVTDKSMRAEGLLALPGILVGSGYPELAMQVVMSIGAEWRRSQELAKLTSALCEKLLLELALDALLAIESIPVRTEALNTLTPYLLELSPQLIYTLWLKMLPVLARERQGLLLALEPLAPVIKALGGRRALSEAARAVRDVSQWWP